MKGMGIGRIFTLIRLQDLRNKGYQYAIIGESRISKFYKDVCDAIEIKDSCLGVY